MVGNWGNIHFPGGRLMPISINFKLKPEEVLKYFRAKGYRVSFAWQDVWQQEHEAAFTVAKMMDLDLLKDTRAAVDRAIAEGQTFQQFHQSLEPKLADAGWWGRKEMLDPVTGETREVQLGSVRRLRTIFRVNMQAGYAAGHWAQIEDNKREAPYLMYDAVDDGRTRPEHRAWDGIVLPADDPFWNDHMPPNGWNCFPAGTLVSGEFQIGMKALYEGPMVRIDTRGGRRLVLTAKHPVLTRERWLSADQLAEGDNVFVHTHTGGAARIENVFDALADGKPDRRRVRPRDFDGDGVRMRGDIEIVGASDLSGVREPERGRRALRAGDTRRADVLHDSAFRNAKRSRDRHAAIAAPIQLDDPRSLRRVLVAAARRLPGILQLAMYKWRRLFDARPLRPLRLGASAQWNVVLAQDARQGRTTHTRFIGELLDAGAGDVTIDEIVRVGKFDFCGHVYDFQTRSGLIVANGIVTSNCRCSVIQLSDSDLERIGKKPADKPPRFANETREYVNPRTGEVMEVPRGVDPGWAYNPGKDRLAHLREAYADKRQEWNDGR